MTSAALLDVPVVAVPDDGGLFAGASSRVAPTQEREAMRREVVGALLRTLAFLPTRKASAVRLRLLAEAMLEEAARVSGTTFAAMQRDVEDALDRVRTALAVVAPRTARAGSRRAYPDGSCSHCGAAIPEDSRYRMCARCRGERSADEADLRRRRAESGLCPTCGKRREDLNRRSCRACRAADLRRRRQRRGNE